MQFIRCAVVGVLMALYLWTDSWCLYVPQKKTAAVGKRNETPPGPPGIQICGNALTTFIIEACDGFLGSLNQVSSSRESVRTQIVEDCCNQECTLDYLQNYCGGTPLFSIKNIRPEKRIPPKDLPKSLRQNSPSDFIPRARTLGGRRSKGVSEVRVRNKKDGKRKSRKKRKRSFKRKCAYNSFGHYLLKLNWAQRARDNTAKIGNNNINRTWPSIQIGTVSPEIDKFGGQPIVVVKMKGSNSV